MRPGQMIVSGDLALRIKKAYGLKHNDPRIAAAMAHKTFKVRMHALAAVSEALRNA